MQSLRMRTAHSKGVKTGLSIRGRCSANGVQGTFVPSMRPFVSSVEKSTALNASWSTLQHHVEALLQYGAGASNPNLNPNQNLSPSPSPSPSGNECEGAKDDGKRSTLPPIGNERCYYPTCFACITVDDCAPCGTCAHMYCFMHLRRCDQCHDAICLTCMRADIYERIHCAHNHGIRSAATQWMRVLETGYSCIKCVSQCTVCRIIDKKADRQCDDCRRVVCDACLAYVPSSNQFICHTCMGRNIVRAHMAAMLLIDLRTSTNV